MARCSRRWRFSRCLRHDPSRSSSIYGTAAVQKSGLDAHHSTPCAWTAEIVLNLSSDRSIKMAHEPSTDPRRNLQHLDNSSQGTMEYPFGREPGVVIVTGQHFHSGYLVCVDVQHRCVHQSQFDYLIELATALYLSPASPYLFWWDTRSTQGDPGLTRQIARRLRIALGSPQLVHNNNKGGYRLTLEPPRLRLCETLWQLPSQLVARQLLTSLKQAHDQFWTRDGSPQTVAPHQHSHVVAQVSHANPVAQGKIGKTLLRSTQFPHKFSFEVVTPDSFFSS